MSQTKTQLVEGLSINTSAPADALAIGDNGEFGIAGNNYGTSGQVLTSQGSGSAPQWSTIASDAITEGNTSAEVVDTGSDGHFKVITEGTEALRVDSSQRVGIGTSGPTIDSGNGIHIHNSTESAIHFTNSSSGTTSTDGAYIGYNSNALLLKNTELGATIRFQTYDSERARIDGSGRLLVGTSSARSPFSATPLIQVEGTTYATSSISITQNSNDSNSANFYLAKSRGGSLGSHAVISNNDEIGSIDFAGADGSQMVRAARIQCLSDGTPGANDMPGRLVFSTTADGASSPTERLRITSGGGMFLNDISNSLTVSGFNCQDPTNDFYASFVNTSSNSAVRVVQVNRQTSDGDLIQLKQANTTEGTISVSGTTVTYGGGHLARWSQLPNEEDPSSILKGTVLSNLDEMCEWAYDAEPEVLWAEGDELPEGVNVGDVKMPAKAAGTEDNEQLNRMKVSDVEGDPNVAGVFVSTSPSEDGPLDFFCAMTGDMIIRIAQGVTVERGDLLMSAGDGTAKPQDDDIIRSKTIAKVTSTHVSETYADGSYCVPCVLMAC